jgi:hypothetical protein
MMLGFHMLVVTGTHKETRLKNRIEIRQLGYLTPLGSARAFYASAMVKGR